MNAPERKARFYVWDDYWQSERVHSFGVDPNSDVAGAFQRHWNGIAGVLPSGAAVLDLACGNGAAGLAIARAALANGTAIGITAIDDAAIDPPRYLSEYADILNTIAFRPRTSMELLPLEDGAVDAVVSQFGIEYGNIPQAVAEAARVLKPNGLFSILALSVQTAAVQSASSCLKQARYLLHEAPLFEDALRIIQGFHEGPSETRDQKMREELGQFNGKVEKTVIRFDVKDIEVVSAIITCLNDVFIERNSKSLDEQLMTIQAVRTKLAHYAARCRATIKAAVGDTRLELLKAALLKSGLEVRDTRSLFVAGHGVIATQLSGQRRA